jgi:hypothetical protein
MKRPNAVQAIRRWFASGLVQDRQGFDVTLRKPCKRQVMRSELDETSEACARVPRSELRQVQIAVLEELAERLSDAVCVAERRKITQGFA